MATADALLTWARSQIGVTENPPGSNHVRYWEDVGLPGDQGQPWCAAFVLAGLMRIGVGPVTRSVYVPQIRADYQRAGRLKPIEQAQPGDQVLFSFGDHASKTHTGIVVSVDPRAHTVDSIDGNTSSALGGVEWNGGGVFARTRPWSQTWGVGHPSFDPPLPPSPPSPVPFPGDHMHRVDIPNVTLDANGNGWVTVPNTQADHVVSIVPQGSYPPENGYWDLPLFGRQQRGADTIIQISEASPKAVEQISIWVAD